MLSMRGLHWFWLAAAILAGTLLFLEFSVDVATPSLWSDIVLALDLALVFGFVGYVIQCALVERDHFVAFAIREKVNLLLSGFVIAVIFVPRLAAAIVITRLVVAGVFESLRTKMGKQIVSNINLRPSQTLALSFIGLILLGTILLMFPAATIDGRGTPFIDALFTVTSAACVVGLSVLNIGTYFSFFGQGVILFCMQVGGLGIMVLSAAFFIMVSGAISRRHQAGFNQVLDVSSTEGLRALVAAVAGATFVVEFLGAAVLFFSWGDKVNGFSEKLWWSIFHAVSAFCNSGLGLAQDSLSQWVSNPYVCVTIMILIIIGGIGFFVIADLFDPKVWQVKKPTAVWQRLQLQTKVVLVTTVVLNLAGMLIFLFVEYDGAMQGLGIGSKILASMFQSVTLRTAGFFSVPHGQLAGPTIIFCMVWMFIGASPGSTGGGIKTTTAAVAVMAVRAMLRGRDEVDLFGRKIPPVVVNRALSIIFIAMSILIVFISLLLGTQNLPFERLCFEAFSALGTVGLTMDLTPHLDTTGRILIIALMYIGRIGPLTMAMAIGETQQMQIFRYPEGRLVVG